MIALSRFLDVAFVTLVASGVALALVRWRSPLPTRRARFAWGACLALWFAMWTMATPVVGLALVGSLEAPPTSIASLDVPALRERTAMVVLSSSINPAVPGDTDVERLDAEGTARTIGAARVWRTLRAGAVIMSGRAPGPIADATVQAMADLAVMQGVPRERVLLEPWSLNTRQNASNSVRLGRRLGYTRFVAVTSALHMPRALREFRRAGVEALPAPVHQLSPRYEGLTDWIPVSWGWSTTNAALHEYLGMLKP